MGKTASLANIGTIADSSLGFRNRIINGAMVIDQRNAGAAVTSNNNTIYSVDRFSYFTNGSATGTLQQSSVAPSGFTNSLLYTITSGSASGSTTRAQLIQKIEGYNIADLAWGTASAKSITLSFWVRSSLTGTFGGVFQNSAQDRSYPYTYTISSANTWEQKSITIAGDTSGTWLTTNGTGVLVYWDMGCGSSIQGTAGAWASADYRGVTSTTSVVAVTGATWQLTGVQLEKGSTATSFDYRPYGTEFMLCQRYYETYTLPANYNAIPFQAYSTASGQGSLNFKVTKRASPSGTLSQVGTMLASIANGNPATGNAVLAYGALSVDAVSFTATVTSGLAAGNVSYLYSVAGATLAFNAEL